MPNPNSNSPPNDSLETAAQWWFVQRDRGLSDSEQLEYEQWLRENPQHPVAIARIEKLWADLDPVFESRADTGTEPDPDLLAPSRRLRHRYWLPLLAGAAAAAMLWLWPRSSPERPMPAEGRLIVHPAPERLTLEDGSTVDLNGPARVEVQFTATERRVRMVQGEAFFTVAKNPLRPFVVGTGPVTVRAVGTAFSVGLGTREIAVLVTEGQVRVDVPPQGENAGNPRELSSLRVGEKGLIRLAPNNPGAGPPEITVTRLSPAQIERERLWQGPRLEIENRPLRDIVTVFNRFNRKQLVVHDAGTGTIRVGGSFRADNVDDFVRFLSVGFGVAAFPHGDELILRKMPPP